MHVCVCVIHVYMCVCVIHVYMCVCVIHLYVSVPVCILPQVYLIVFKETCLWILDASSHAFYSTFSHTPPLTHTHTHTHTRTHTHAHAHTLTHSPSLSHTHTHTKLTPGFRTNCARALGSSNRSKSHWLPTRLWISWSGRHWQSWMGDRRGKGRVCRQSWSTAACGCSMHCNTL